jgi:hypothetical protein
MKVGSDIPLMLSVKGRKRSDGGKPFSVDVKGGEFSHKGRIANTRRVAYRGSITELTKGCHQ